MHSVFGKINYGGLKTQHLIFGTGTAIWWVTEPHYILCTKVHLSAYLSSTMVLVNIVHYYQGFLNKNCEHFFIILTDIPPS